MPNTMLGASTLSMTQSEKVPDLTEVTDCHILLPHPQVHNAELSEKGNLRWGSFDFSSVMGRKCLV